MTAAFAPTWALAAVSCLACLAAALVDARTRRLPNPLVALVAACALAQMLLAGPCGLGQPPALPSAPERIAACALTLAALLGAGALWRRLRDERGMGMGDVKLLGAIALWLGAGVAWALALACLLALAANLPRGRRTFAFGPYLALSFAALLALALFAA